MDEFNEKINKVLEYLDIPEDKERRGLLVTKDGSESMTIIRIKVRKILGLDKQCSVCNQWKFKYDLSLIEDTEKEICQDCLEKVMRGELKLNEDVI